MVRLLSSWPVAANVYLVVALVGVVLFVSGIVGGHVVNVIVGIVHFAVLGLFTWVWRKVPTANDEGIRPMRAESESGQGD